jgi:S1-C subfamily serine protease
MVLKLSLVLIGLLAAQPAGAATPKQIFDDNVKATVYIEVDDSNGRLVDSGSGVIVSHDGWIVTAAHLKPDQVGSIWAVIGERVGTRYKLEYRDVDEPFDVALGQLPQSETCRHAATLSTTQVEQLDRVLVMGFPSTLGLTPTPSNIASLHGDLGFYKADGLLEGGNSGGPVFNELGQVVATVQGGTLPGTGNNDLVPIGPAISLLKKHNVAIGVDASISYATSCYAMC